MDKTPIIIIIAVILAGTLFWAFQSGFFVKPLPEQPPATPTALPAGIVFFYGDGCPHCKNVEDYVAQNKIADKVKFTSLEVYNNKGNAALLANVAIGCKLDVSNGVGIPLLYDGKNCVQGDVDVINFFKTQAGIK